VALTEKTFELPDIKRVPTTAEFVTENGKITKLILTQEQPADFIRVQ
jgi:ribosomal protein S18